MENTDSPKGCRCLVILKIKVHPGSSVKRFPLGRGIGEQHIAVLGIFLGDGDRAGIHVDVILMLAADGNVGVAVKKDITLLQGRQFLLVKVVTVCGIYQAVSDELGKDGGFILSEGKMLSYRNDAKRENYKAVCDFVAGYKL